MKSRKLVRVLRVRPRYCGISASEIIQLKGESIRIAESQLLPKGELFVLEIEEGGEIKKLMLAKGQICLEGFRLMNGKLVRGVPKRSRKDCLKYCRHESCDFL